MADDQDTGTQGNGDQTPQGDVDTPQFVTEAQLNKAISARLGAFERKLEGKITEQGKAIVTELGQLLDERVQAQPGAGGDGDGDGQGQGTPPKPQDDPRIHGLERQVQKLNDQLEQERGKRQTAADKARDATLRSQLSEGLAGHGIDGKRGNHAIGYLVDASKRVRFAGPEEDAQVVFVDPDGTELDLATGLADWAKSEDAKLYQAPSGASGSGARQAGRGGGAPPGSGGSKTEQIGAALQKQLGI